MKKKTFCLLLASLLVVSGCNSTPKTIDFTIGTLKNEIIELEGSSYLGKDIVQKDSFVLAVHDGDSCLCWREFKDILINYNEKRLINGDPYIPFFSLDSSTIDGDINEIEKIETGYIDLYLYKDGEMIEKVSGAAKKNSKIFESLDEFTTFMDKRIGQNPINNLNYISIDYYTDYIKNNAESGKCIVVIERSGCRDCAACIPNVLIPYAKENKLNIPIYVIDIENYRQKTTYNTIKSTLLLTQESSSFGFNEGYVPTYQYYENGQIKDAGVYLNDTYDFATPGETIYISDSYFDKYRECAYTDVVLTDKTLDFEEYKNNIHKNIFLSFLEYYNK